MLRFGTFKRSNGSERPNVYRLSSQTFKNLETRAIVRVPKVKHLNMFAPNSRWTSKTSHRNEIIVSIVLCSDVNNSPSFHRFCIDFHFKNMLVHNMNAWTEIIQPRSGRRSGTKTDCGPFGWHSARIWQLQPTHSNRLIVAHSDFNRLHIRYSLTYGLNYIYRADQKQWSSNNYKKGWVGSFLFL